MRPDGTATKLVPTLTNGPALLGYARVSTSDQDTSIQQAKLRDAEGHHPDMSFGWGYGTVSLRTKKIKGLHENDFILAAKIDRLAPMADEAA